ncbi:MAG: thiamine pyrophosphate-dependent enzyme [Patescibacteria group bacterium]|nr:thiamine pyrophosphate-dependent enzyme [Patescibacteria group bacterium]
MNKAKPKINQALSSGHRACAGCGQIIAARLAAEAAGHNTIISNATGCLEVTTTPYPETAWGMPWIHSLFENAAAVASGIRAGLNYKKKSDLRNPTSEIRPPTVIAQGGDGASYDIGFGLISGMWERGEDILYICYDNEAYMNTGVQASGATPYGAHTTTSPAGKQSFGSTFRKKNMPAIAIAHRVAYVATATVGYPMDIKNKIKKALSFNGPKYVQILVPCIPGWGIDPKDTIKIGKLAHQTGLWPVFEAEYGKITKVMPYPQKRPAVEEYLKPQKRFKHLFKSEDEQFEIKKIQKISDENIKNIIAESI